MLYLNRDDTEPAWRPSQNRMGAQPSPEGPSPTSFPFGPPIQKSIVKHDSLSTRRIEFLHSNEPLEVVYDDFTVKEFYMTIQTLNL
jgi:hypothetical protein